MNRIGSWALVLTSLGCASAGHPGDRTWQEVTTPHFVLRTDADGATALDAAARLENTRDMLTSAGWPNYQFPEVTRTEVYVLSNGLDFERLFGRSLAGMFQRGTRPSFYLYGSPNSWESRATLQQDSTSILRHEMIHQLAASVFPHEPRWFAEGFAQFLETAHEAEDGQSIVVGSVNVEALKRYNRFRTTTVERMFAWREPNSELPDAERMGLYGLSWLFVHWLMNAHHDPLVKYELELVKGAAPPAAWATAFPSFDADAATRDLFAYSHHGDYEEFAVPLHRSSFTPQARSLPPAAAHVAYARIVIAASGNDHARSAELRALAADEINKALQIDPTNVGAIELEDASPAARLAQVKEATVAHPDEVRGFRLLGHLLAATKADVVQQEAAFRQAVKLDENDADALNDLAWLLVEQHKPAEALPLALRAVKRAPYNAAIIDTYAFALYGMGRCQSAIAKEEDALELQGDASSTSLTRELSAHLREFKSHCTESR